MFHVFSRKSKRTTPPPTPRQFLNRALSFGAGLVLLWLALNLMPQKSAASGPVITPIEGENTAADASGLSLPERQFSLLSGGQIAAGLLLVGLMGFAYYRQKKVKHNALPLQQFKNLGRLQLGPQQHIHLIGCGSEVFMVGATNQHVTLLHQVMPDALAEPFPPKTAAPSIAGPTFSRPSSTQLDPYGFPSLLQHKVAASHLEK